jgi:hypothetical protein
MLFVSCAHMRLKRAFRQRIFSCVMSSGLCQAYVMAAFRASTGSCKPGKAGATCGFSAHTLRAAALSETTSVCDERTRIKEAALAVVGQFEFS